MTAPIIPVDRTHTVSTRSPSAPRRPVPRRYLMCPPEHFAVEYAINPWMDPAAPVDRDLAMAQWQGLVDTYGSLGHEVVTVAPEVGLPDMVFAANGALVVDGIAVGARFATPQRAPEAPLYREHLRASGLTTIHAPRFVNEGEGDLLVAGDVILAGTGYRTDPRAHGEIASLTGREVVPLRLIDPRYYHLDVAACVLDDTTIAYLPGAFDADSRDELRRRFPDAIEADERDAEVLGLNAVSDGRHVVMDVAAEGLAAAIADRGFEPIGVDLSELRKAGGGVKCCTMELRPAPSSDLVTQEVSA